MPGEAAGHYVLLEATYHWNRLLEQTSSGRALPESWRQENPFPAEVLLQRPLWVKFSIAPATTEKDFRGPDQVSQSRQEEPR